jgi:hypothetical protein
MAFFAFTAALLTVDATFAAPALSLLQNEVPEEEEDLPGLEEDDVVFFPDVEEDPVLLFDHEPKKRRASSGFIRPSESPSKAGSWMALSPAAMGAACVVWCAKTRNAVTARISTATRLPRPILL